MLLCMKSDGHSWVYRIASQTCICNMLTKASFLDARIDIDSDAMVAVGTDTMVTKIAFPVFTNFWPVGFFTLFSGFLLGNLPEERQSVISKEHICAGMCLIIY